MVENQNYINNKRKIQLHKYILNTLVKKQYFLKFFIFFLPYELSIIFLFIGLIFINTTLFLMGGAFLLLSIIIYSVIPSREIDYLWWDWLDLYRSNFKFELIMIATNILISTTFFIIHFFLPHLFIIDISEQIRTFIIVYFLCASLIGLKISQKIANYHGAKYVNIFKQSPIGVISYSKFAYILLSNHDERGLKVLINAMKHLKHTYKKLNNKIVHVEATTQILDNYNKYSKNIPYDDFSLLALNISNYNNVEHLLKSLDAFVTKEKYIWTRGIIDTKMNFPPGTQMISIISIGLTVLIKIISLLEQTDAGNIVQSIWFSFNSVIDIQIFLILYIVTIILLFWAAWIIDNGILKQIYKEYMY